jgi:rare lipoprotein A
MRPPQNNPRRCICVGVVMVILSLGGTGDSSGQMLNTKAPDPAKPKPLEGLATWYKVPEKSLSKRRARKDELTGANNRLPLGTQVRVTHLANKKNVVVRITDRGIYKRGVVIDLCKEAAEKLDMVHEGSARVRLEILPGDRLPTTKPEPPW